MTPAAVQEVWLYFQAACYSRSCKLLLLGCSLLPALLPRHQPPSFIPTDSHSGYITWSLLRKYFIFNSALLGVAPAGRWGEEATQSLPSAETEPNTSFGSVRCDANLVVTESGILQGNSFTFPDLSCNSTKNYNNLKSKTILLVLFRAAEVRIGDLFCTLHN